MRDNLVGTLLFPYAMFIVVNDCSNSGPDTENPGHHVKLQAVAARLDERRMKLIFVIWPIREAPRKNCKEEGEFRKLVRDELMLAAPQRTS